MHLAAVETAGRALAKGNAYLLLSDDTAGPDLLLARAGSLAGLGWPRQFRVEFGCFRSRALVVCPGQKAKPASALTRKQNLCMLCSATLP